VRYDTSFTIGGREIGPDRPTYFIADIASNHDGDLERARALIWQARDAGADAAKFQHFLAEKIVSDYGFRNLDGPLGHQSSWDKPVFEIYKHYEFDRDWNAVLADEAAKAGIDFMTTPYDAEAIDALRDAVPAFKVGSGDITWTESLVRIARCGKPVLLATGASTMEDVERAVEAILDHNRQICIMQCNTNYTGDAANFGYQNLRVLQGFALRWPGAVLGFSDHTSGHAAVLGAVALGARVVEKHFTDDNGRSGPDHGFAMNPETWAEMVARCRELEAALGDGIKRIEDNERDTIVVQRRCLRLKRDLKAGAIIAGDDLEALRPAPPGAIPPWDEGSILGGVLCRDKVAGDALNYDDVRVTDA